MILRHLKVFGIAAVFAAIAYGLAHLAFRLIHG